MNGNPINQIAFSVPPTIDLHAFCTLLSYNDRVTVTITVDANLFSEAQCNAMLEAFNEDLTAIVKRVDGVSIVWCCLFKSGAALPIPLQKQSNSVVKAAILSRKQQTRQSQQAITTKQSRRVSNHNRVITTE